MYDALHRWLFRLEPEQAHTAGTLAARLAQRVAPEAIARHFAFEDKRLRQTLWGLPFPNPVGLAAGFDKNARLVRFWPALGFGFAEIGSVTARPSKGNPKPRAFRLPDDEALVNRMGLGNQGAARIARRLDGAARDRSFPLGINLAKTHDPTITGEAGLDDFRTSFRLLAPHADYVALNISCPNTAEGKTFEEPETFDALLTALFEERKGLPRQVPVLVKLSPPVSERVVFDSLVEEVVAISRRHGVSGFIAANTAADREGLATDPEEIERIGPGGLSGPPIERRATGLVRYLFSKTEGEVPIIGVGGVRSAETAYAKIRAGASLVQLYTGLVYHGPGVAGEINRGLVELLERDGFRSLTEAVGADHDTAQASGRAPAAAEPEDEAAGPDEEIDLAPRPYLRKSRSGP